VDRLAIAFGGILEEFRGETRPTQMRDTETMSATKSYEEVIDFIAAGATPEGPWSRSILSIAETDAFMSLFNPRRQRWNDHFALRVAAIEQLSAEGKEPALADLHFGCWR
jgi:hypothetical protein